MPLALTRNPQNNLLCLGGDLPPPSTRQMEPPAPAPRQGLLPGSIYSPILRHLPRACGTQPPARHLGEQSLALGCPQQGGW